MNRLLKMFVTLVGVVSCISLAVPASANGSQPGTHCAVNLDTGQRSCYNDAGVARQSAGAARSLVIATMYDGRNFTGSSQSFYQARPCTASYDSEWFWGNLGDLGWNNRMSSLRTFNKCDVKIYDGNNWTGESSTWIDQAANLAQIGRGWDNRVTSLKFS